MLKAYIHGKGPIIIPLLPPHPALSRYSILSGSVNKTMTSSMLLTHKYLNMLKICRSSYPFFLSLDQSP